jgi:hypothetical protein
MNTAMAAEIAPTTTPSKTSWMMRPLRTLPGGRRVPAAS